MIHKKYFALNQNNAIHHPFFEAYVRAQINMYEIREEILLLIIFNRFILIVTLNQ